MALLSILYPPKLGTGICSMKCVECMWDMGGGGGGGGERGGECGVTIGGNASNSTHLNC